MKRDMDLIRAILLRLEQPNGSPLGPTDISDLDVDQQLISYNVMMAAQGGLIDAYDMTTMGPNGFRWVPKGLTWHGHEYLDSVRDDEVWKLTKATAKKIGGFTLEILTSVAKEVIKFKARELGFPI